MTDEIWKPIPGKEPNMTKDEFRKAVSSAERIFGYVQVWDRSPRPFRISKTKARALIRSIPDDATINAEWADDDTQKFLLVG